LLSIDQILQNSIIIQRLDQISKHADGDISNDNILLQTIKIPKNLLFLSDRLPRSNYEKQLAYEKKALLTKSQDASLPDISIKHSKAKSPNNERNNNERNERQEKSQVPHHAQPNIIQINNRDQSSPAQIKIKKNNNNISEIDVVAQMKMMLDRGKSPKKESNYNNINSINLIPEKKNCLPDINSNVKYIRESSPKKENNNKVNHKIMNSDHINQIYQVYAPYLKNGSNANNAIINKYKYGIGKFLYLTHIDKYYDYNKLKKMESNKKIINRKLSPLKKAVKI
jgi:hypothetical protein